MLNNSVTFDSIWVLYCIPFVWIVGVFWWWWQKKQPKPAIVFSTTENLKTFKNSFKNIAITYLPLWRLLPITFLMIALARPQSTFDEEQKSTQGIDIVLAVDVSASMLARDFKPCRLEAAKKVAFNFIDSRPYDRIGLVVFGGESFTQCPPTTDHKIVKQQLFAIKNGLIEDGTAIGMGLATATQRLKDSDAKTKVVILMTDGVNNRGLIDPNTATEIAMKYKIRCYTIGVGSNGMAMTPVQQTPDGEYIYDNAPVQIDEPLLRNIAKKTGGSYFRATGNSSLQTVFDEIDKLEKTKFINTEYNQKTEKYYNWLLAGFILLLIEILLRYTWLKTIT